MTNNASDFSLPEFLPYLLNQAAEAASLEFQKIYKDRYGMLRTDWRVLFHLGTYGPMTAKEIVTRSNIHKTKISRAAKRLEDRRFLTRCRDHDDKRYETLRLTKAGLSAYRDLRGAAKAYDTLLTKQFSPDETALLRQMLRRLA